MNQIGTLNIEFFSWNNHSLAAMSIMIRTTVFVDEQGVPANLEIDGNDHNAFHIIIHKQGEAMATARYRITENGCKFERFAVLKQFRGIGLGRILVEETLKKIPAEMRTYLHAQHHVVDFYRSFGFEIEGDSFTEAGILHYNMVLKAAHSS